MKIYGNDGKLYDTVAEAKQADKVLEATKAKEAEEKKTATDAIAAQKKELSNKIDLATKKYEDALANYDVLKVKAEDMIREANKNAYNILLEGAKEVEKASSEKMNLIKEFNEKFNRPFTKYYTGSEAEAQYNRIIKKFTELLDFPFTFFN